MKKLLTLALAASMILAMSVNAFALGNYVLSTDEVGTEEEEPIADEPELPPNQPAGQSRRSTRTPAPRISWSGCCCRCCCRHRIGSTEKEISFSVCTRRPVFRTRDFFDCGALGKG